MTEGYISRREQWLVVAAALAASIAALAWCSAHQALLLYGDAVAHLHIARRIFDSHSPGLRQLGSVWLPLPHLLLMPFVAVNAWWHSGFAGAVPSMICYVLAALGLYRLARKWMGPVGAMFALVLFAANPNLLYLQTTAMTEPLCLCEMIWAALWLVEWHEGEARALTWATVVLLAAVFTRYDGWIFAFFAWIAVAVIAAQRGELRSRRLMWVTVALAAAPLIWFAYNWAVFGDALDFMRGPYSAKAIEARTSHGAMYPHPGWHSMRVAAIFFLKAAKLDAAYSAWSDKLFVLAACGVPLLLRAEKAMRWTLLLWIPLPFYAYSVAYGSVPIFVPVWWPHSWYNTRYGVELLPAIALFAGFALDALTRLVGRIDRRAYVVAACAVFVLMAWNVQRMLAERPLVYAEAVANSRTRVPFERDVAAALRALPPEGAILMNTSAFAGALEQVDFPLRRTITESDFVIFQQGLAAPAAHAAYVVAFDGDAVAQAVKAHPEHLRLLEVIHDAGQPAARVYASDTPPAVR